MIVVAVIALLVIGPERLPAVARKVGRFIGKARAFINTTRSDIEQELRAEEMKAALSRQEQEINELRNMMQNTQQTIHQEVQELDESLEDIKSTATAPTSSTASSGETPTLADTHTDHAIKNNERQESSK